MEGYLLKQGEKIKIFKRRWFVIRTGNGVPGRRPHLYYYERPDSKEKGRIDLEQVNRIQRCDDAPKDVHEFALFTQSRIYRLRAASVEEMDRWVTKLKEYVSLASNTGTNPVTSQLASKPSQKMEQEEKHLHDMDRTSHRAASVMLPKTNAPNKTNTASAEAPAGLAGFSSRNPHFDSIQNQGSNDIRNSMKDLRSAALGSQTNPAYSSQPTHSHAPAAPSVQPAPPPSWNAQEDSQELQTARKRLAKAQKLISKHENEIQLLRVEVSNLKRENKELQKQVEGQGDTVDHDKRRREAELDELQRKLLSEKKLREELSLQYQDVRNELRVLKDSIHIARTAPNVYAAAKSPSDLPSEPTVLTAAPVKSNESEASRMQSQSIRNFTSPYPDKRSLATLRSSSVSNIPALYEEQQGTKRVAWIRDELVTNCKSCNVEFGLFTRKHHCRHCGYIFCNGCSDRMCKVPGYPAPERVCHNCFSQLRSKSLSEQNRPHGSAPSVKQTPPPAATDLSSDPPVTVLEL